ncbi:MAG: 50S ribosomal protein L22 [Bacteroidales bacterium]|jgi:large subunit ribosomal protein L22|nr:50S ribosomal protein L22 [Bacteroidales bacterium]HOL98474.1 50S ribosomal protein L22 [Bacteroidales bacterium]HOM36162.1 50S ribosomal protein L22 [Bacteroidales bacterium]HPD23478.1 50S ribosomal protein L22 [Bacteroidales bacterium]HRS99610.1 50S ribosomal protein L22 [Bacteroidales bacterium]
MGARKRIVADKRKEEKKKISFAILRNCPSSPRKMRLVADLIRGVDVDKALDILRYSPKAASINLEKLLKSAIANWQVKNEGKRVEDAGLYVKQIYVNEGRTLKRIKPAPQGRAYRIRKRSNHVTIVVDSRYENEVVNEKE